LHFNIQDTRHSCDEGCLPLCQPPQGVVCFHSNQYLECIIFDSLNSHLMNKNLYLVAFLSLMMAYATCSTARAQAPGDTILIADISGEYTGETKDGLAHGMGVAKGTDTYEGHFKNGLPHGQGKYTWTNGDYYQGQWKKGKKHGKGVRYIKDKNHYLQEVWRKGKLIESVKKPWSIDEMVNVHHVKIERNMIATEGTVRLRFIVNRNKKYKDTVELTGSDGYTVPQRGEWAFKNVSFPFKGNVTFRVRGKGGTRFVIAERCIVAFTIYKPGAWDVTIDEDVSNL